MNIADPNLLEIIAKHIDNKPTFNNFAKSSKTCSKIARKLAEIKKFEFKHINFERIYGGKAYWDGCHTKGMINDMCVRVWFYPSGLEIVYDSAFDIKDYNDKFDFHNIDEDYLLGDFCQIRERFLNLIIDALKSDGTNICDFTLPPNRELADLKYTYYEITREIPIEKFIDSIKNEKLMIYNDGVYIFNIWIVRNLKAVIEELEKVSELCNKK